jgi:hypothetical protein
LFLAARLLEPHGGMEKGRPDVPDRAAYYATGSYDLLDSVL